ncbi:hypothetical protein [Clostridium sp.]|uniref:hypothetical protein n=1 Tax=Clostridium sp. TaxID=1506 RepID=UPI003D6CCD77
MPFALVGDSFELRQDVHVSVYFDLRKSKVVSGLLIEEVVLIESSKEYKKD